MALTLTARATTRKKITMNLKHEGLVNHTSAWEHDSHRGGRRKRVFCLTIVRCGFSGSARFPPPVHFSQFPRDGFIARFQETEGREVNIVVPEAVKKGGELHWCEERRRDLSRPGRRQVTQLRPYERGSLDETTQARSRDHAMICGALRNSAQIYAKILLTVDLQTVDRAQTIPATAKSQISPSLAK